MVKQVTRRIGSGEAGDRVIGFSKVWKKRRKTFQGSENRGETYGAEKAETERRIPGYV
jgi:hypothetical protein